MQRKHYHKFTIDFVIFKQKAATRGSVFCSSYTSHHVVFAIRIWAGMLLRRFRSNSIANCKIIKHVGSVIKSSPRNSHPIRVIIH
jgi:hypothetical protein